MTARPRDLCIMACVFCRDPLFREWIVSLAGDDCIGMVMDEAGAKAFILHLCRVESRTDLDTDPDAALRFHSLIRQPFVTWKDANP